MQNLAKLTCGLTALGIIRQLLPPIDMTRNILKDNYLDLKSVRTHSRDRFLFSYVTVYKNHNYNNKHTIEHHYIYRRVLSDKDDISYLKIK